MRRDGQGLAGKRAKGKIPAALVLAGRSFRTAGQSGHAPIGRRVAETLAKRADRWLATPDKAFVCNSDSSARSLTTQVTELAAHGWISGDRR
jgi:hypothetical protein